MNVCYLKYSEPNVQACRPHANRGRQTATATLCSLRPSTGTCKWHMAEECFSYIPYLLGSFLDATSVERTWREKRLASVWMRAPTSPVKNSHDARSASTSRRSWRQPTGDIPLVIGKVIPCHLAVRIEWRSGWRGVDLDRLKETYRLYYFFTERMSHWRCEIRYGNVSY
jgi:hypothetical protein